MVGELERTGLEALMNLSGFRGPAKEYLDTLNQMIVMNKNLDNAVKAQATALKTSEKDVKRAAQSMAALGKQVEATGRFYASFGRNLQQFGKNMSRYITLPLLAAGGASAKFAMDFEQKMANIQSIGKQTTAELGLLGDELIAMSTDLSLSSASAIELADTFYFLQGSGFAGKEAIEVLKVASQGSQAGMSGLQEATDALVYSLNAYGAGADEARHFSDTLFKTVDLGIVGYEDLAGAVGLVTGTAASAGVSFVEMSAAIATISRTTKGASRVARELNMFLDMVTKPTKNLTKFFVEATGHTGAWMLKNKGLAETLRVIQEETGGSAEKIKVLFGNVRAGRAVTSLIRGDLEDFNEILADVGDSAGATADAARINIDTAAAAMTNLKNVAIAAGIKLATEYLPQIKALAEAITKAVDAIGNMTKAQKDLLLYFGAFIGLLGPAASMLGTFLEMYGNLMIAWGVKGPAMLGKFVSMLTGPAGLVVALAVAVIATKKLYDTSIELNKQFEVTSQSVLLTAKSYEEYAEGVKKATGALPEYQTQLVFSHGKNRELREGMVLTREEFENFQATMDSLGSVTQSFSDSLDEGNLSLGTLKEMAQEAADSMVYMKDEAARFAAKWQVVGEEVAEIPEEFAIAWEEASKKITDIMRDMPDILEENEAELNKIVEDYEKERLELRELGVNKQKKLLGEHQAELIALEAAYNTRRLELVANNDTAGIVALDKAYQKKRNKILMDYNQDELDLGATNKRKQLELDRAHLEDLIAQHKANQASLEEQRKKLGTSVWMTALEEAMKDKEVDEGEKEILRTLQEAFGLNLDTQLQYNLDSLELTKQLAAGNLTYAQTIAEGWAALASEQGAAADGLQAELDALPTPEEIMGSFNFAGVFDAVGGAASAATSAVAETDSATASLADTVKNVAGAIEEAIVAFESLAGYETDPRLRNALTNISADIRDAVTILIRTWREREDRDSSEAKHAAKFAARAMTVMEAYGAAATAFKAAAEYSKVSAKTLGDIADNIIVAVRHMARISDIWEPEYVQEIATFAQQVSIILSPFATMAEVAKATVDYSKITRESIGDMTTNMQVMLGHFNWLYNNTSEIEQDALVFAEAIAAVTSAMGNAADSMSKLDEYTKVGEYHMKDFLDDLYRLANLFDVPEIGEDMLEKAKAFAEFMEPVASTVSDGTDALATLSTYSHQAVEGVEDFVDDLEELAMRMLIRVPWFGENSIAKLKAFAEAIAPVSSIVSDGVEGLIGLRDYSSEAIEGAEDFVDDIHELTMRILVRVPWMGQSCIDKLEAFANSIKPASEIVSSGMAILSSLEEYSAGAEADVFSFMRDIRSIVNEIAAQAKPYGIEITKNLEEFSKAVKPAADIVKDGLDILSTISDYTPGTEADVFSFMRDLRSIVTAISQQAKPYGKEIVDNLTDFASAIAPSATIVKDGMDILSGFKEISAPTTNDVQSFINDLTLVLGMLEDQLPSVSTELIDELTAFSNAVGPAAEIVGDGVDALVTLGEEYIVAPSEEALQIFIDGLLTTLQIIKDNLPVIEEELITELTAFAEAIGPVGDIIKSGMEALEIPKATVTPAEASVIDFMDALKELVRLIGANLPTISNELIIELTRFSDAVDPAAGIIKDGIDALEDIGEYEANTENITANVIMLLGDLVELKDALRDNLPTISLGLIGSITEFKEDIELIAETMKSAIDLLEQMTGLTDLPSFKSDLMEWSNTIIDTLDTLLESMETFLDKHPEITAAEFRNKAEEITTDLNIALMLLAGYEADAPSAAITTTGFASLANAIHEMSLSAIADLDNMGIAIRNIIRDIAAIPRTVIVRFVSDSSGFSPPATGSGSLNLPSYDTGGIVPGPVGKPQLAIVHGGEAIVPPASQTQYNSMTSNYNTTFSVDAHYANHQSEASVRDDLSLMQLMHQTG